MLKRRVLMATFLWAFSVFSFAAEPALNKSLNEEVVLIPNGTGLFGTVLETTFFKPSGDGPFPLVVINHGKALGNPRFQERARYQIAVRQFVKRGYVVMIPMRSGFSRSSGNYIAGGCSVEANGLAQAKDVRAALDYAIHLPYVDRTRILMMGQSHGGLTAIAFGTQPYPGVRGLVNFAGGLRRTECVGWEQSLISAFEAYGVENRFPGLWFYGANDSYWSTDTIAAMHSGYVAAGGKARMVAFGNFKTDAHGMFSHRDGLAIWWPEVEVFLKELGLPTEVLPRTLENDPVTTRLREGARMLSLSDRCRELYQAFLDSEYPRAFAVSEKRCGYAFGGENPQLRALESCRNATDFSCRLFAVDDAIVALP